MTLQEMLEELARFYPIKNRTFEDIQRDLATYRDLIVGEEVKSGKAHDWDRCLRYIQLNRKYSTFPSIPEIIEALPHCIKDEYKECEGEGSIVVITTLDGREFQFVVSAIGRPLNFIKEEIKKNFGGGTVRTYPKGTVITGGKVILPE